MILESIGDEMEEGGFITGIAGKKGFSIITIAKTGMSSEPGSLLKILNVLAKHEVNVEYLPSSIDNVSLVSRPTRCPARSTKCWASCKKRCSRIR